MWRWLLLLGAACSTAGVEDTRIIDASTAADSGAEDVGTALKDGSLDAGADSGRLDSGRLDSGDSGEATDASIDAGEDAGMPMLGGRVFVSSTKQDGAMGGLVGADQLCQGLADTEGLGGVWLAWLGDGTDGPSSRFLQSTEPYRLVGGVEIAADWADLIDGTLFAPINRTESGDALPMDDDMIVWTAVFHTGGNPTPVNCMGWTDNSNNIVPTGRADRIDTGWTVTEPRACSELHRIYCFEN